MRIGDLVVVLYEKRAYSLIIAEGPSSSTFVVMTPGGTIRTIPRLELRTVLEKER